MELPQYTTVLLPRQLPNELLLRKYATLSIEAIRAIYDRVLLHAPQFIRPLESWDRQLKEDGYSCHLLLAPNVETGAMTLEEGQWVGMFALQGPLEPEAYNFYRLEQISPSLEGPETRWLGLKLYLKEQHRNLEAMRLLRQAVMGHIERETKRIFEEKLSHGQRVSARMQSSAYIGTTSYKYHQSSGAKVVAELSRREDLEYDGYLDEVPKEFLNEDMSETVSAVFEYVIDFTMGEKSTAWI